MSELNLPVYTHTDTVRAARITSYAHEDVNTWHLILEGGHEVTVNGAFVANNPVQIGHYYVIGESGYAFTMSGLTFERRFKRSGSMVDFDYLPSMRPQVNVLKSRPDPQNPLMDSEWLFNMVLNKGAQ